MTGESQVSMKAIYLNWELYLSLLIDIYSRLDGRLDEFLSYLLNGGRMVSVIQTEYNVKLLCLHIYHSAEVRTCTCPKLVARLK